MTYAAEEQATTRESGAVEVMDAVFRKTILGYNESEHHHVLSRPQLRRLLDLIDGEQGLDALVHRPSVGQVPPNWRVYVEKLPNDPWGHQYQYVNPGVKGEIDVFSFGADGQPGGEGRDADIGSWQ